MITHVDHVEVVGRADWGEILSQFILPLLSGADSLAYSLNQSASTDY